MTSRTTLEVSHLSKAFRVAHCNTQDSRREPLSRFKDRFWALKDINCKIYAGETVGIIGANGSGKSTFLKILAGVMTQDEGNFVVRGRIGALLELGAGFHPDLTGLENVYLNGAILGLSSRQVDFLLPQIIEFCELESFMDTQVKHYSSGMIARLGFAVATQLDPEIILMDETFSVGDIRFQARALEHLSQLKARGCTMLLVSHQLETILKFADRVLWLDHGILWREGSAAEMITEYRCHHPENNLLDDRLKSFLGAAALFQRIANSSCCITSVQLAAITPQGVRKTAGASNQISIFQEDILFIELEIKDPKGFPNQLIVETAWSNESGRVQAQSQASIKLLPSTQVKLTLKFDSWILTEGVWTGSIAITDATNPTLRLAHQISFGSVRVLTPSTIGTKTIIEIPVEWTSAPA